MLVSRLEVGYNTTPPISSSYLDLDPYVLYCRLPPSRELFTPTPSPGGRRYYVGIHGTPPLNEN